MKTEGSNVSKDLRRQKAYLLSVATHGAGFPLGPAQADELFPQLSVWLGCQAVVHAWQIGTKYAALATLATDRASTCLVFCCEAGVECSCFSQAS